MQGAKELSAEFELEVREEGGKLPVSKKLLKGLTSFAFQLTGRMPGDVSLLVSNDGFISELNEEYLGESGPTDVLSFPMRGGEGPALESPLLGDVVISIDTAARQACSMKKTLGEEFCTLFVHGLLHLLGYTHDTEEEGGRMKGLSDRILSERKGKR